MGSLAEICLAVLLFPVLRKMAVLKLVGVQFESAVRYHVWIGNLLTLLAAAHGAAIMSVWASKGMLLSEVASPIKVKLFSNQKPRFFFSDSGQTAIFSLSVHRR